MCVQYWPASREKQETYGGITIQVIQEEELANFQIRTIRLQRFNEEDVSLHIIYFLLTFNFLRKFSLQGYSRRANTTTISLYRMAQSYMPISKCSIRISKAGTTSCWKQNR